MRSRFWLLMVVVSLAGTALAAKPHVVSFGKVLPVKLFIGPGEDRSVPMNVRALLVDGKLKEFTTGESHTVTDRIFVVRRAFRVNDSLPADQGKVPRWVWQRGGWLMVDRTTARITQLNLPFFDPFYSQASWFRDYAAYAAAVPLLLPRLTPHRSENRNPFRLALYLKNQEFNAGAGFAAGMLFLLWKLVL